MPVGDSAGDAPGAWLWPSDCQRLARTPCAPTIHLALVLLLFCCGLRRGEQLRLRLRHFDASEAVLRVDETKSHKSRLVPLVANELRSYIWSCCGVSISQCNPIVRCSGVALESPSITIAINGRSAGRAAPEKLGCRLFILV